MRVVGALGLVGILDRAIAVGAGGGAVAQVEISGGGARSCRLGRCNFGVCGG